MERMGYGIMKEIDSLIKTGLYENEEGVITDAVRALLEKNLN